MDGFKKGIRKFVDNVKACFGEWPLSSLAKLIKSMSSDIKEAHDAVTTDPRLTIDEKLVIMFSIGVVSVNLAFVILMFLVFSIVALTVYAIFELVGRLSGKIK